jgi:hypothetical protein
MHNARPLRMRGVKPTLRSAPAGQRDGHGVRGITGHGVEAEIDRNQVSWRFGQLPRGGHAGGRARPRQHGRRPGSSPGPAPPRSAGSPRSAWPAGRRADRGAGADAHFVHQARGPHGVKAQRDAFVQPAALAGHQRHQGPAPSSGAPRGPRWCQADSGRPLSCHTSSARWMRCASAGASRAAVAGSTRASSACRAGQPRVRRPARSAHALARRPRAWRAGLRAAP